MMKKTHSPLRATILLCFLFLSQWGLSQTTYLTVGCGGGSLDFASLRGAFQWVETNYFPADVDISICPGTYNDNAFINPFPLAGSRDIYVHSSTYNPADVTIRPASGFQTQVLRVNGVRRMDFEGISFDVLSTGTGIRRHAVRLQGGAGDIEFKNCKMKGAAPSFGFYNPADYAVASVRDLQGVLQFFDSEIRDGAMGLHIQSTLGTSVVNLQHTEILFPKGHGFKADAPITYTLLNDCVVNCFGTGTWNGITTEYGPGTKLEVTNSSIITHGASKCHAIQAEAEEVVLENNNIMMADHAKAFGITLHSKTASSDVYGNEIAYPGAMYSAVRPDSFMGIQRNGFWSNQLQLEKVRIDSNRVECTGAEEGAGIYVKTQVDDFSEGIFLRKNEVELENMGGENAFWILGLALKANSGSQYGQLEIKENRVYMEPLAGYVSYGIWATQMHPTADGQIFNNVVEMAQAGTDSSTGMGLNSSAGIPGPQYWVGNNAISLENGSSRHANGMYIHMNIRGNFSLWHNSISVHGNNSLFTSDALQIWGSSGGSQIDLLDNVFANFTGGRAFQISYHPANWTASNSNCYYSLPSTNLGWWDTYALPDLAAVRTATGGDMQSVELDPGFVAPNNLHLGSGSPLLGINGIHLMFGGATYELNWDIDGDPRLPTNNREIGCDERGLLKLPGDWKTSLQAAELPRAYPNPCRDWIKVEWAGHEEGNVSLVNVKGQLVRTWQTGLANARLDLSDLPRGTYLLKIEDASGQHSQKIMLVQ